MHSSLPEAISSEFILPRDPVLELLHQDSANKEPQEVMRKKITKNFLPIFSFTFGHSCSKLTTLVNQILKFQMY